MGYEECFSDNGYFECGGGTGRMFEKYKKLLQGISFTSGTELTIDETGQKIKNDFELIEKIDIILQDLIGFNAFTDLISGILSISKDSSGFNFDWILHLKDVQSGLIGRFNIHVLSSINKKPVRKEYLSRRHSGAGIAQNSWFFSNIKLNGFWRS